MATQSPLSLLSHEKNAIQRPAKRAAMNSSQKHLGTLQRAQQDAAFFTPPDILQLQRMIGNHKTLSMLGRIGAAQEDRAQLHLSPTEHAAEQTAEQSVESATSVAMRQPHPIPPVRVPRAMCSTIQTKRMDDQEYARLEGRGAKAGLQSYQGIQQAQLVHGPMGGAVEPHVEQSIQRARGGGQPLADEVRRSMEQNFNADFQGVRVHADARADRLSRSLNARAFTTGKEIFFRAGEYKPNHDHGKKLLTHELTHVVQQNGTDGRDRTASTTAAPIQRKFSDWFTLDKLRDRIRGTGTKTGERDLNANYVPTTRWQRQKAKWRDRKRNRRGEKAAKRKDKDTKKRVAAHFKALSEREEFLADSKMKAEEKSRYDLLLARADQQDIDEAIENLQTGLSLAQEQGDVETIQEIEALLEELERGEHNSGITTF